jgi:beta-lactamase regulating signal transducer with metallopeptidase domain
MMNLWGPASALPSLCQRGVQVGLDVLLQTTLLLVLGMLGAVAVRRRGPALQSLIYKTTLLGVLGSAVVTAALAGYARSRWTFWLPPAQEVGIHPAADGLAPTAPLWGGMAVTGNRLAAASPQAAWAAQRGRTGDGRWLRLTPEAAARPLANSGDADPTLLTNAALRPPPLRTRAMGWLYVATAGIWLCGLLVALGWLTACHAHARRLRRSGAPVEGEAAVLLRRLCATWGSGGGLRPPQVLANPFVRSPILIGFSHPAILLPISHERDFTGAALRAILAHEVTHLARKDCWWNLAARLTCAVGWVQPLLWGLCRRMEQVSEEICDRHVVEQGCPPAAYAGCLLDLAERLILARRERAAGAGVVPSRSSLGRRVQQIMEGSRRGALSVSAAARTATLLGMLVGVALGQWYVPASAQAVDPNREPVPPALRGDHRLDAKVTLACKNQPMGELLASLGSELKVSLRANPRTADDKVSAFLDQRPAVEVLALLARHFDFKWYRNEGGYEIAQDAASMRREAALRDGEAATQFAQLRTRMEAIARLAGIPRERLEARQKEIDRVLAEATSGQPELPAPDRATLIEEKEAVADVLRPGGAAAASVLRSLTPAQIQQLRDGSGVKMSTRDGTLPDALAGPVHQAVLDKVKAFQGSYAFGNPYARFAEFSPTEAGVVIHLSDAPSSMFLPSPELERRVHLSLILESVRGSGRDRLPDMVEWSPNLPASQAPSRGPTTGTDDTDLKGVVELTFADPRWRELNPGAFSTTDVTFYGGGWPARPTLGEVAEALRRATGLEVLADSFVRARIDPKKLAGRKPVIEILDTLGRELAYTWQKEGRLIRFRSRVYYRDRPMEVPDRVLRPWRERVSHSGTPTLDDLGELAAGLTDAQCLGMQRYWGWYVSNDRNWITKPHPPGEFYGNRNHFRFWATLVSTQKRAALAGAILPVSEMSGRQRLGFAAALTARPDSTHTRYRDEGLARAPTSAEVAAGGFSLKDDVNYTQEYEGRAPDGSRTGLVASDKGTGPTGKEIFRGMEGVDLKPKGPPVVRDVYRFTYYLGGDPTPARTAEIDVPRARRTPPGNH